MAPFYGGTIPPASTITETQIIDGAILARVASTETITGLWTFNRGAAAPFAVAAGSLLVSNLDADKLDGQEGSFYQNAGNLNAGSIPDARVPASAVTQHQAALTILETQITDGALLARVGGTETITGNWTFTGTTTVPAATVTAHQAALTILETQITDGALLARVGGTETITGNWTFVGTTTVPPATVTAHESLLTITEAQITDGSLLARTGGTETITAAWTFTASPLGVSGTRPAIRFFETDSTDTDFELVLNASTILVNKLTDAGAFVSTPMKMILTTGSEEVQFLYQTEVNNVLHVTGTSTPATGDGVEIHRLGGPVGLIQTYNRTGAAWIEMRLRGSKITLHSNGTQRAVIENDLADFATSIRATDDGVPSTGAGTEVIYSAGVGYIAARDRGGATYSPMRVDGSEVRLATNGTVRATITTTEFTTTNVAPTLSHSGGMDFGLNDSGALSDTDCTTFVSFESVGIQKGWVGYGSSLNTDLTLRNNIAGSRVMLVTATGNETVELTSGGDTKFRTNGTLRFTLFQAGGHQFSGGNTLWSNNLKLQWRNVADSASLSVLSVNSSDQLDIGRDDNISDIRVYRPTTFYDDAATPSSVLALTSTAITATVPFRGANGSVGDPTYSFSAATTSGFYWDSGNTRIVVSISSTAKVLFASGFTLANNQIISQQFNAASAIDWNDGNNQVLNNTGSRTITFANPQSGGTYYIRILAGSGAASSWTWPSTIKWPPAGAPALTTTLNKKDLIALYYDGTDYLATYVTNY